MRIPWFVWIASSVVLGLIIGCGGSAKAPEAPSTYAEPATSQADDEAAAHTTREGGEGEAAGGTLGVQRRAKTAQPPPPAPGKDRTLSFAGPSEPLLEDFLVAESAVLAAGANCVDACRALRSMMRATERLCELAGDSEQGMCQTARERVKVARARVRASCASCAGGPSLE